MNKDFHYYGTYAAARFGGYNPDEASIIAHAAQYVDDSTVDMLLSKTQMGFLPMPTFFNAEVKQIIKDYQWSEDFYNQLLCAWPAFHFLPGNFNAEGNYVMPYRGKNEDKGIFDEWKYDDEAKERFKLMCLPNSILASTMIDDLNSHSTDLILLGIRMHVLADTWAHYFFAGIPAWFINQDKNSTIYAKAYNDILYLGHVPVLHMPDNPSFVGELFPQWNNYEPLYRNNPDNFLQAFLQLAEVMRCVKSGNNYTIGTHFSIDDDDKNILLGIFKCQDGENIETDCEVWQKKIHELSAIRNDEQIIKYEKLKWKNEAESLLSREQDITQTNYYKFNQAAIMHFHFVKQKLAENSIELDEYFQKRIAEYYIMDDAKYFLTSALNGIRYFYPTYSENQPAQKMQLIIRGRPNNRIYQGDVVYIRTQEKLESVVCGEVKYLGAWKDSANLYYYTKEFSALKQKWQITQPEIMNGELLDLNNPVFIKNEYCGEYLAPDGKGYLTTTKEPYRWFLR